MEQENRSFMVRIEHFTMTADRPAFHNAERPKFFLEKVTADTSFQNKLKTAASSYAVLAITKEAGLLISAEN